MKKLLLLSFFLFVSAMPAFAQEKAESTFERVMRTKTLRCAYIVYPMFVEKDPNTGEFSGLYYDIMTEMGKLLGLKIEWGPELAADTGFEGIGRSFDANCTGYSPTPARSFAAAFTKPIVYMPYVLYIRADETRFKTLADFNSETVRIATLDGEESQTVAREQFPKAKTLDFSGMASVAERLESVASGKADVAPFDAPVGGQYVAANPGKLKAFTIPIRVGTSAIALPHGEQDLKEMFDITIDSMLTSGALARIVAKYEKQPGSYYLPAIGYAPE
jgi:polar amino acid transport system substrate-binding protein